ncbi:hypothetical protein SESBI_12212 [Sesbania bispinosa]|nr:hypothetical protein SESBI_12212 [Sesbania bispinosa]
MKLLGLGAGGKLTVEGNNLVAHDNNRGEVLRRLPVVARSDDEGLKDKGCQPTSKLQCQVVGAL